MAAKAPQSFENHAKMVPGYHYLTFALVLFVTVSAVTQVIRDPGMPAYLWLALALSLILLGYYARVFSLGVQDRVIRLEERMRMQEILPEDLRGRISEFSTNQLIGMRFASDAELPALARRVLDERIEDRKAIKKMVSDWRADHQRV